MANNDKDFVVKNGLQVGNNTTITGSLTAAGLSYPVSDGDERNAIITDGSGNLSFDPVEDVRTLATNNTGSLISKGTPVYQTGTSGQTITIAPADASNSAKMPAVAVASTDIADGNTGWVIHSGRIQGVDTSAFSEGDVIYVAVGGGYTNTRPATEANLVQNLGLVTKVHATSGSGIILGPGRTNAAPNLNDGNIFIGDSNDYPVTATLDTSIVPENTNLYFTNARAISAIEGSTNLTIDGGTLYIDTSNNYIGINDTSPQQALDVTGAIAIGGTTVIDSGGEVVTAQLKDSGVTSGTYGSASAVPVLTIDAKGRVTSASSTAVAGVSSTAYDTSTGVLTINTSNGGSFTEDLGVGTADSPTFAGLTTTGNVNFGDNDKAVFGAGNDLQIYHSGTQSIISDTGTGNLNLEGDERIVLRSTGGTENYAQFFKDGGASIYYDNAVKLATTSSGVAVTGNITSSSGLIGFDGGDNITFTNNSFATINVNSIGRATFATTHTTFNDNGDDVDFRVESDTNQYALFVQGSDGHVGIGTSSPAYTLVVSEDGNDNIEIGAGIIQRYNRGTQAYGAMNYYSSSHNFYTTSGGQHSLYIKSDGNVGIGTSTPNSNLHIKSTSDVKLTLETDEDSDCWINLSGATSEASIGYEPATNSLRFANAADGVTSNVRMTIDASGNVGIGTTSPTELLDLGSGNQNLKFGLRGHLGQAYSTQATILGHSVKAKTNGTISGGMEVTETNSSGGAPAAIRLESGTIEFHTAGSGTDGATFDSERMIINSSGNVGIGTSSPSAKLQVDEATGTSTNATDATLMLRESSGAATAGVGSQLSLSFDWSGTGTFLDGAPFIRSYKVNSNNSDYNAGLKLGTRTYGVGTATVAMTIDHNQNVGIGTTSPDYPLHVNSHDNGVSIKTGTGSSDANHGLRVGTYLHLLSTDSHICHNMYYNSGWSQINSSIPSSNIYLGSSSNNDIRFGYAGTSDTSWSYIYNFRSSGNIEFGTGGEQPGNGNTYTGAGFRDVDNGSSVMFSVSRDSGNTCRFNRNGTSGSNINMSHDGAGVGSIDTSTTGTTYNTTSDRRLKDNITTITDGKYKLLAMNPITHTWKADPNTGETVHGFIAQEMQHIVPEAVSGDPDSDEMMSMDYGRITPVIVAALKDALNEIEELKTRIKTLEAK